MATDPLWPAILAVGGALLGGLLTGWFSLLTQRANQQTERDRWVHEARDRVRARLHDTRLAAYADFDRATSSASGYALKMAIDSHGELPDGPSAASAPNWRALVLAEYARDVNSESLREMGQHEARVRLVGGSQAVRLAAEATIHAVFRLPFIRPDDPDWAKSVQEAWTAVNEARGRFLDAAQADLNH